MKNIFKICDLFGTEFHWYFDYKPKYYTFYGGIFSILSICFCIFVFFIFGIDDFRRINPISTISNIPPLTHKTIQFGKQKLYIPWRIMDYGENFINHKGILFPRVYYFTNKHNNKTGLMETQYKIINYTLCSETPMKNLGKDFIIDLPLDKLFCIDMDDLEMGGSWNAEFVNYIRLDLNLCKDGIDYDENNENCTSHEFLNKQFGDNNNWFFELLYPSVQFQPSNKTMPILVLYTSYYYGLSTISNKVDRIYIQEHIFEDDIGWIFNKPIKNFTYWGVSSIKTDYYTIGKRDIFRYGSTSRLYSLKLYLDYGTVFYNRKYKKLIEIFSEILPILKGISTIFCFLSTSINKLKIIKILNEYIIGNEINLFETLYSNVEKSKNHRILNNIKLNYQVKLNQKKFSENIINKKNILNNCKDSSHIKCVNYNSINNELKLKNEKKIIPEKRKNLKSNLQKTLTFNIVNPQPLEIFEKKTPHFPLSFYFIAYLLNKISIKGNDNYLCISKKFDISFTFFTHLIDITSYISLYQQFEVLKKLVLENNFKNYKDQKKLSFNTDYNILLNKDLIIPGNLNYNS